MFLRQEGRTQEVVRRLVERVYIGLCASVIGASASNLAGELVEAHVTGGIERLVGLLVGLPTGMALAAHRQRARKMRGLQPDGPGEPLWLAR